MREYWERKREREGKLFLERERENGRECKKFEFCRIKKGYHGKTT